MPYLLQPRRDSSTDDLPRFSARLLTEARLRRGLSKSELHLELARLGLRRCRGLIDRWDQAVSEPRASELAALAAVLGIAIADLFEAPSNSP